MCFLMRESKVVDPDRKGCREELGGVEGGETVIRIYNVRKRNLFPMK